MVPRGSGGLLNVSSLAGFQPVPSGATYAATKAFVTSLSEALHEEVRGAGVHVTALCPGFTRTAFQDTADVDRRRIPDPLWLDATTVARAGLDGVTRNTAVVVPGLGYRAVATGADLLPRGLVRRLAGQLARRS